MKKFIFKDSRNDKRLQKEARRVVNKELSIFIGSKNYKKIKNVEIRFIYRWSKSTDRSRNDKGLDFKLWNEKDSICLWVAPEWLKSLADLRYGIRHELVHLKDIMNKDLIILSQKPFIAKYRFNNKSNYKTYKKIPSSEKMLKAYESSWMDYVDYISKFFPWERKAHLVSYAVNI